MKWSQIGCILILVATAVALALRLPQLDQRPMHGDEAVGAVKFGSLLEENYYRYDPFEYHGPTLYYLTLIPAWLSSDRLLSDVNEYTLRIVPVFFGTLLILLLLPVATGLGWPAVAATSILTAISPAMVFYSRYYIHEMLLVVFTLAAIVAGYRYIRSKGIGWALLLGISLGLMYATKETSIVAFGSMLLALLLMLVLERRPIIAALKKLNPWHCAAIAAAAVVVSVLFFSSFFTNPRGIIDSLIPWGNYFNRAAYNEWHIHPWYYYLEMLIFTRYTGGPIWSEALLVVLAAIGFIYAMSRRVPKLGDTSLIRFIAFYTILMTIMYSAIPYKTPWNMLGFLHGMILLAGIGLIAIFEYLHSNLARVLVALLLLAGGIHLTWQAYQASYRYHADPANPYVYAHSSIDVLDIVEQVYAFADAHPEGRNLVVEVICTAGDYWPLPWYLRSFPNVGWWDRVNENVPPAPIILASPSVEQALIRKLYELPAAGEKNLYVPLLTSYKELRPGVELRGYVMKDLWDSFQQRQTPFDPSPND
ncbi:flippase activity-associated protein Agl23 [Candidatus Neomarinimicrobiota bacterium]